MERSLGYVQFLSSACFLSQMLLWHVVQICILLTALPSFLLWKEEAKASRCWKWKHKMCLVKTSHFRSWCTMHVCIYWCQLGYQVPSSETQTFFDLHKIIRQGWRWVWKSGWACSNAASRRAESISTKSPSLYKKQTNNIEVSVFSICSRWKPHN